MAEHDISAGVSGRCPRCGEGRLFDGFITLKKSCPACGLDYSFADSGDGPAVLVILLAGFVVVGLALFVEVKFQPPLWLHFAVFMPLTLIVCLGLLRPLKAVMARQQYIRRAGEGRSDN